MKIVINKRFGGFSLSEEAYEFLGRKWDNYGDCYTDYRLRTDPDLIRCVETLGSERASGSSASLKIIEIPDGCNYDIEDYDGIEKILYIGPTSWS